MQPSTKAEMLSTGIETLDNLLGGDGFRRESVILIRGEPGTGKTTLALQIAAHALKERGHSLFFVCAEDIPQISLNQITESFWGQTYGEYLGDSDCAHSLAKLMSGWTSLNDEIAKQFANQIEKELQAEKKRRSIGFTPFVQSGFFTPEESRQFSEQLSAQRVEQIELEVLLGNLWTWFVPKNGKPLLVVIDSLNALIYWAQRHFRAYDDRQMLLAVIRSFEGWWNQMELRPTVIFTAEDTDSQQSKAAESYIADVVIELRREMVIHPTPITPGNSADWKEDLLFCQVLKGRGLPTQRRPCCYEFVGHKGIDFFPTYAAQGLIFLFHENRPQWEVIQNLRTVDMPSSYPGVIVQDFTLSGLQRMFAIRRYERKVPPRHPMLLSHVDEYWVNELRKAHLLYRIPPDKLHLFRSPLGDSPVIGELEKAKRQIYCDDEGNYLAVPQMGNVGMLVYRKDLLRAVGRENPPETWEEVEDICQQLKDKGKHHRLLLETQTYDTLIITCLELGWGHGAIWHTTGSHTGLHIEFDEPGGSEFKHFVAAFERLHKWIHKDRLVPLRSSVDPAVHPGTDWVFARHWYSTWIDVLTRPSSLSGNLMAQFEEGAEFGIARIPISEEYRQRQKGVLPKHHSGAGEWYLVIQANSENVELGIDLINNLMTSRRVTERALSGVELPVLQKFYDMYGSALCFGTDKTYNEIREMFAANARSRTEFAEYPRVARVLYGALQAVITNEKANVRQLLEKAFSELDPGFNPQ